MIGTDEFACLFFFRFFFRIFLMRKTLQICSFWIIFLSLLIRKKHNLLKTDEVSLVVSVFLYLCFWGFCFHQGNGFQIKEWEDEDLQIPLERWERRDYFFGCGVSWQDWITLAIVEAPNERQLRSKAKGKIWKEQQYDVRKKKGILKMLRRDGPTDGPTDRARCRVACARLKRMVFVAYIFSSFAITFLYMT